MRTYDPERDDIRRLVYDVDGNEYFVLLVRTEGYEWLVADLQRGDGTTCTMPTNLLYVQES